MQVSPASIAFTHAAPHIPPVMVRPYFPPTTSEPKVGIARGAPKLPVCSSGDEQPDDGRRDGDSQPHSELIKVAPLVLVPIPVVTVEVVSFTLRHPHQWRGRGRGCIVLGGAFSRIHVVSCDVRFTLQ